MGSLDANGVYIFDTTDKVAPLHTTLNLGQASVSASVADIHRHSLILPVANTAERDAYEADMRAAGNPPTQAAPLWVEVADSGDVYRNRGAGWKQLIDESMEEFVPTNSDPAWVFNNKLYMRNGVVVAKIAAKRTGPAWSGNGALWQSLPPRFRPLDDMHVAAFVHKRNDIHKATMCTIFADDGGCQITNTTVATGNWVRATITWLTPNG